MILDDNSRWIHPQLAKHSVWPFRQDRRREATSSLAAWSSHGLKFLKTQFITYCKNLDKMNMLDCLYLVNSEDKIRCLIELQDAITWLISPPDQSLALLLADEGYDVWLVSTRGTRYSSGHTSLSPDDAVASLPTLVVSSSRIMSHDHSWLIFLGLLGLDLG